jgi:putative ABC transport system permease protein
LNVFESDVLTNPEISTITLSSNVPGLGVVARGTTYEGRNEEEGTIFTPTIAIDYDFLDTYGLEIIAGRNFNLEAGTDHNSAFVINEATVKDFGWETPEKAIGKTFNLEGKEGSVIGVIKDFHYISLREPIGTLILHIGVPMFNVFSVKMETQNIDETLAFLETQWKIHFPEKTFEYSFLESDLADIYQADRRLGKIISVFAFLAILVSCLGTYGLAMLHAQQREKEVGIRKVLGASVAHIIGLLSKGYMILIALASLIGIPLAYWSMHKWLENFAYQMELSGWLFALSVGIVLLIVVFTISYQTLKAALANPVHALRDE